MSMKVFLIGVFSVYFLVGYLCWASYEPGFVDEEYNSIKLKEKVWLKHLAFAIELCFTPPILVEINITFNIIGNILHDQRPFWLVCMHKIKTCGDNGLQGNKFFTGAFSQR